MNTRIGLALVLVLASALVFAAAARPDDPVPPAPPVPNME